MTNLEKAKIFLPFYVKSLCPNNGTFERGRNIFKQQRVFNLSSNNNILTATVLGSNKYDVEIKFNDKEIEYHKCNCEAHRNYPGMCKHIVAAILKLNSQTNLFDENGIGINLNKVFQTSFIGRDYDYSEQDINEIYLNSLSSIVDAFKKDGEIDDEELLMNFRSNIFELTYDPGLYYAELDLLFDGCEPSMEEFLKNHGIKIVSTGFNKWPDESAVYSGENDYCESEIDDDFYDNKDDREIDNGYRDDYDYSEG